VTKTETRATRPSTVIGVVAAAPSDSTSTQPWAYRSEARIEQQYGGEENNGKRDRDSPAESDSSNREWINADWTYFLGVLCCGRAIDLNQGGIRDDHSLKASY
jgi:hypothetical protein